MKNKQVITITSNEENPEPVEIIADSIIKISEAFEKINNGRLKKRAIILLIKDAIKGSHIGLNEIETVLDAAARLKDVYLNQNHAKK